jgi:hypothetical protein
MTDSIVAQSPSKKQPKLPWPSRRQRFNRRRRKGADYGDPIRHLVAAVALQAVQDLLYPKSNLERWDWDTARQFVAENEALYRALDIPAEKIRMVLELTEEPANGRPSFGGA